ncbi:hypothetical protein [Streptomyces griseoviridis]|uniref:hypothetical protein n=1 Tax=Streptomyces griseoviridis TaxID=45398 RepID=UPI00342A8ED8
MVIVLLAAGFICSGGKQVKKIHSALAVGAAALTLVFVTSTSSFAGADGPQVCNAGPQSACAKFYNDGDVIRVWDTDCDGHAAVAVVQSAEAGIYENVWNTAGCNTYVDRTYGTSMPEDVAVYYKACYGVYSTKTITRCSGLGGGRS